MTPHPLMVKLAGLLLLTVAGGCADEPLTAEEIQETPEKFEQQVQVPCEGYTLFGTGDLAALKPLMKLVDMSGKDVKEWNLVGYPARMLPGGAVMGGEFTTPPKDLTFEEVPRLVQQSWDGKELWSFNQWGIDPLSKKIAARQHHDLQREGNPVGYYAPGQAARASGATMVLAYTTRESSPVIQGVRHLDDTIYMVGADGKVGDFRWYASEHFNEFGFDDAAVKSIRERLRDPTTGGNWLHLNSANWLGPNRWYEQLGDERFHPRNIMISSRDANFIAIIDHKTGKLVWRVGPDFSQGKPEAGLGQLVGQHHAHMIPRGLPGAGNILLFDNGGLSGYGAGAWPVHARNYSRVLEFNPVTLKKIWQYGGPMGSREFFFCVYVGGQQRLPNGNTLILHGIEARMLEVTWKDKKVVWKHNVEPKKKGWVSKVYRAVRVPPEWLPAGINPAGYSSWATEYPAE